MSDSSNLAPPAAPVPSVGGPASDSSRAIAAFGGYFPLAPLGLLALAFEPYKGEPWLRKHVLQGAAFFIIGYLVATLMSSFPIGLIMYLIVAVALIVYAIKAFKGEDFDVPVITDIIKGWVNPS